METSVIWQNINGQWKYPVKKESKLLMLIPNSTNSKNFRQRKQI